MTIHVTDTRWVLPDGSRCRPSRARLEDVPALVRLLADDPLGSTREGEDMAAYERAFQEIDDDPHQFLTAVRNDAGGVVGTMQLTVIPGLSRGGARRLQVESVRVSSSLRSQGLGERMFTWAETVALASGCSLLQLTTDTSRPNAHRFYERLGYRPSHIGFKKQLQSPGPLSA
ncbi:GNAT family N-acetyltransferase [Kocuria tytonis]|uniref:GNAT family N-acetyltransferase n=1 Tax=Kocuria tytonis TaxID=2054280 RepID=A0A495A6Z5_9MICC|nr:GNAT family N-acetyltransferase [Kocuria tytonis]RKQ34986.1 GNAT family N-acetyltransferase [Kocuria tytonis]